MDDIGSGCTREQCRIQPGNTVREHWPLSAEEVADNTVGLDIEFCLSPVGDMSDAAKRAGAVYPWPGSRSSGRGRRR